MTPHAAEGHERDGGFDHLWVDPTFGASGDMTIAALIAVGADVGVIEQALSSLKGVPPATIRIATVERSGLRCTRARVVVPDEQTHRRWSEIDRMIAEADLPGTVAEGARRTFRRLGEVEASIHRTTIEEVHFHEVGALDSIVDIVGAWQAWHLLGEPSVSVGPFGLGHGTVKAAHGLLPLPAPAVLDLLTGWESRPLEVRMETVTPTGAAILTTMATSRATGPPAGTIVVTGRGAGEKDPDGHPNALTAVGVRQRAPEPQLG